MTQSILYPEVQIQGQLVLLWVLEDVLPWSPRNASWALNLLQSLNDSPAVAQDWRNFLRQKVFKDLPSPVALDL